MEFSHLPVLPDETIEALNIRPDGIYVDATTGGGGHSSLIAQRLETGRLLCIDQDEDALKAAKEKLAPFADKIQFAKCNFKDMDDVVHRFSPEGVDGILYDLGVSSYQLDTPQRGFSYMADAPLDMRMDRSSGGLTAYDVVNTYPLHELRRIISQYGEERYANNIAYAICKSREKKAIETTFELVAIIKGAMPKRALLEKQHPAKRTFQSIRVEVNGELEAIKEGLAQGVEALKRTGRVVVISFHSLEDRIVKHTFLEYAKGCTCPKDAPICICGKTPKLKLVTKGIVKAGELELQENPRARSAKLRAAEKL